MSLACISCETELPMDAKFCGACGTPQAATGGISAELKDSLLELYCGDEISVFHWLNQKCPALGHKTPADTIMNSPEGEATVKDVIIRLEYGVHQ